MPPTECMLQNQDKKILGPLASGKGFTRENLIKVSSDQKDAVRAEALVWLR